MRNTFNIALSLLILATTTYSINSFADSSSPIQSLESNSLVFKKVQFGNNANFGSPSHIYSDRDNTTWLVFHNYIIKKQGFYSQRYTLPGDISDYISRNQPSIRSYEIFNKIVFSYNKQLIYYDKSLDTFIQWDNYPVKHTNITGLSSLRGDSLWVTTNFGIYHIDTLKGKWNKVDIPKEMLHKKIPTIAPTTITAIDAEQFIIGSFLSALYILDTSNNQITFKKYIFPGDKRIIVRRIIKKSESVYTIATSDGMYEFSLLDDQLTKIVSLSQIGDIKNLIKNETEIWFYSNNELYVKRSLTSKPHKVSISSESKEIKNDNSIIALEVDKEGSIWVSVENKGIYYYSKYFNKLEKVSVNSDKKADEPFDFIGFDKGHLLLSYGEKTRIPSSNISLEIAASSIINLEDNSYLLGGFGKSQLIKNNKIIQDYIPPAKLKSNVVSQAIDHFGRLWLINETAGPYLFELESGAEIPMKELFKVGKERPELVAHHSDNEITLVYEDRLETLLIESERSTQTQELHFEKSAKKLTKQDDNIFIHHTDMTISRYNLTTKIFKTFNFDTIENIGCVYNNGNQEWWISQVGGNLHRINLSTNKNVTYSEKDGIPTGGLNGKWCIENGDFVYFSSYQGLLRIAKNNDTTNNFISNVWVSKITNSQDELLQKDSNGAILVQPEDFPISLNFVNPSQVFPQSNLNRYQLKGLNKNWVNVASERQKISYETLNPGSYTFSIQGSNSDGVWGNTSAIELNVLPTVWMTWWAKSLYFVILICSLILFYRIRTQAIRKRALLLEKTVELRTKELEEILDNKAEEFANVSHEFRTPLTLILGPIKKLIQIETEESKIGTLETVKRNGFRLLRMVDQLLHMEKFRVQQIVSRSPICVKPISKMIGESFQDLAEEKNIRLTIEQLDDVWLLLTPDALEKILLNLLSNAIKYTQPDGDITLSVIAKDNIVKICVSDTGIGLTLAQQSTIFGRFNRVLDNHSEQITGAGIGLALVKDLVNNHSGNIEVSSEKGIGSTFTVALPQYFPKSNSNEQLDSFMVANREIVQLEIESVQEQKHHINTDIAEQSLDGSGSKTTILVVEDNPDMRSYISTTLSDSYNVLIANNGKQGLEFATSHIPDLIVSDVMMPEMDGYTLCRSLKNQELTSHIPLILLTARSDRESRLQGWKNQADEYLTKPFDSEELLLRVENLLHIRALLKQRFYDRTQQSQSNSTIVDYSKTDIDETKNEVNNEAINNDWESHELLFINKFIKQLEMNLQNPDLKIEYVAKELAMSERQLYRKLKGVLNVTPGEYLRNLRLEKALALIKKGEPVSNVAFDVGFSSHSYFSRCFKAKYDQTPTTLAETWLNQN